MQEIIYHLIYPYITFKEMMNCRQICKTAKTAFDYPPYWIFINMTDIDTRSRDELLPMLAHQNYLEFYNLSGTTSTIQIPVSLLPLIANSKLIIY